MKLKIRFEDIFLFVIISIGVAISILQFASNRSLWLDEAYLALNIINLDYLDLLNPLEYNQVAPVLFLEIEKVFSLLIGTSEFGLRAFPLLSYWISIIFLYKILVKIGINKYAVILSMSFFLFNGTIVYYSSEVKQYMTDVMVLSYMYYFTLKDYTTLKTKYISIGTLGIVSVFLSNIAPIILFSCGIYLICRDFKKGWTELRYLLKLFFAWFIVFGLYFFLFIKGHPTKNFMVNYWSMMEAFMPGNPFNFEFYRFLNNKYYEIFYELFDFGTIGFYILPVISIAGIYNLIDKKKLSLLVLIISPILLHLFLSSLKLYPFDLRLILYFCPLIILLLAFGFELIFSFAKILFKFSPQILALSPVIFTIIFMYNKTPIERSELKKCFIVLQNEIKTEDRIYVTFFSSIPLKYYSEISVFDFPGSKIYYGNLGGIDKMINEINTFEGRYWFIFSDYTGTDKLIKQQVFKNFQYRDIEPEKIYSETGASVILFDINQ